MYRLEVRRSLRLKHEGGTGNFVAGSAAVVRLHRTNVLLRRTSRYGKDSAEGAGDAAWRALRHRTVARVQQRHSREANHNTLRRAIVGAHVGARMRALSRVGLVVAGVFASATAYCQTTGLIYENVVVTSASSAPSYEAGYSDITGAVFGSI